MLRKPRTYSITVSNEMDECLRMLRASEPGSLAAFLREAVVEKWNRDKHRLIPTIQKTLGTRLKHLEDLEKISKSLTAKVSGHSPESGS